MKTMASCLATGLFLTAYCHEMIIILMLNDKMIELSEIEHPVSIEFGFSDFSDAKILFQQ